MSTHLLWEPDSINYALALERFDLRQHIPHPPGYLFFVLAIRVVHHLVGDPNKSIILVSIAANILTACLLAWLANQIAGRWVAFCSTTLLVFNHIFWYYGHLSTIYPMEGLAAISIACATFRSMRGDKGWGVASGLVLGLAGGFRGMIVPLLFPLWAYGIVCRSRKPKNWIGPTLALVIGVGLWLVPTCFMTGGLEVYRSESRQLFLFNLRLTSFLFAKEPLVAFGKNFLAFVTFSLLGLSYLGVVGIVSLSLVPAGRRWFRELIKNRERLAFFGLWMGPPMLFYLLTHIPKPGYLMTFLPSWQLLLGWLLVASWKRFFAEAPTKLPIYVAILLTTHVLITTAIHLKFARSLMIKPANDHLGQQLAVPRSSLCPKPTSCLLLLHQVPWRQLYYYLPEYTVGALIDDEVTNLDDYGSEVGWARGRRAIYASGHVIWTTYPRPTLQQVPIPKNADVILWYIKTKDSKFYQALMKAIPLHGPLLKDHNPPDNVFFTHRAEMDLPLQVGAFQFVEEDGPPPESRWWVGEKQLRP